MYQASPVKQKKITFLTGAGISADSGIPTYRGTEGIWIKNSVNYKPEEFGTFEFFKTHPKEVWYYALFRKLLFQKAFPNKGHEAIAEAENTLQDRFHLITQNIDGLHKKAGNSDARLYEIHGNLDFVRCSNECTKTLYPFPIKIDFEGVTDRLIEERWELLQCPACGSITRPNILWFDETYNERYYKRESCLKIAKRTCILISVGTSFTTNLPKQIAAMVLRYGGIIIDINAEKSFITSLFPEKNIFFLKKGSSDILPLLSQLFQKV